MHDNLLRVQVCSVCLSLHGRLQVQSRSRWRIITLFVQVIELELDLDLLLEKLILSLLDRIVLEIFAEEAFVRRIRDP